jgi:hypothetical protein
LLTRGLTSGRFTSGLLRASHYFFFKNLTYVSTQRVSLTINFFSPNSHQNIYTAIFVPRFLIAQFTILLCRQCLQLVHFDPI